MERLLKDLRYSLRIMLKKPAFTAVAVIALALGIGANTAIFSVVNVAMLRPLPFKDPGQLVWVWDVQPQLEEAPASFPEFYDWRSQAESFAQMGGFEGASFNLTGVGDPERIRGVRATAEFLPLLGVQPATGRSFLPEEDREGGNLVAILSHGLWQRRFGADPNILGQTLTLNGNAYTIIGILPPDTSFLSRYELWVPLAKDVSKQSRGAHSLTVIGRLKPGVTLQQAQADIDTVASRLRDQYSTTHTIKLTSLHDVLFGDARPLLLVLLGTVAFVLLIACANVANLQLARAAARQKEIAIRTALGASRARLVRQLLTESMLLSLVGGAVGVLLALVGLRLIVAFTPANFPWVKNVGIDGWVLGFTFALSLATGVIFGLLPAMQTSRPNLNESLKEGGRSSTAGVGRQSIRSLLVVAEIALALVLLVGAGLMIKSFVRLMQVNPGFNPENVLTMQVNLPQSRYREGRAQASFYQQLIERTRALPGVEAVGIINNLPLGDGGTNGDFSVEGRPPWPPGEAPLTEDYVTSADYFRAMRIPLMRGRYFTERDTADATKVALINESFARRVFPDEDPIGKRIDIGWPIGGFHEIVGVVGDVKNEQLHTETPLQAYLPYLQTPVSAATLVLRTDSKPENLAAAARSQVMEIDSNQPVYNLRTLERVVYESVAGRRFNMFLLGFFAILALVLAAVGVYGVMSYSVSQRTHEIGIRMALGARGSDVLRLVVGQGMILTLIGVAIGLGASLALTRVMTSLLFEVSPTDPMTFTVISLILTGVALGACFVPARRALKVDPMVALRYE